MPGKGINGRANMQKFQMNSKKYGGNPFKYTSLVSSVGRASKGGMWNSIQSRTAPPQKQDAASAPAAPTYVSSSVSTASSDVIFIIFSENIVLGGIVTATDFTINGTFATTPTITAAYSTPSGKIAIQLSDPLVNTDTLTITFNKTTSSFGNAYDVASFGPETVTNNVISAPGAPTSLAATLPAQDSNTYGDGGGGSFADGGVSLSWTEPLNNGGSTILSYEYQVTEGGVSGGWNTFLFDTPYTTGIVPNLNFNQNLTFKVRAVNTIGTGVESAPSNTVSIIITVPAKPQIVPMSSIVPGTATQGVKLTYFSPTDGGLIITNYEYQQAVGGGAFGAWTALNIIGAASGRQCFQIITGLTNGLTYTYKVRASNDSGNSWSTVSDNATLIFAPTPIPNNAALLEAIDDWLGTAAEKLAVTNLYGSIEDWNTAQITDMSNAFANGRNTHQGSPLASTTFNDDISGWDTAAVLNMSGMFYGCTAFNNNNSSNINLWDTGSGTGGVTNMSYMFAFCSFNQPIGWWDVSLVTDMNNMFRSATNFNQEISRWDVSSVTDMTEMFSSATNFNNGTKTFLFWPTTDNVISFESMFESASNFNQTLIWNISDQCNSFRRMFKDATSFNGALLLAQPGTGTGTGLNAEEMFHGASSFTGLGLPGWQGTGLVGRMGDLSQMFQNAAAFNQNLSNWRFKGLAGEASYLNVNDMNSIFEGATALATNNVTYAGTGTADALSWKDAADFVYGLRVAATPSQGPIPNFYVNSNGYDGASTATQFPKITA